MPARANSDLAKQLWAVGDPVRLRILRLLPQESNCEGGNNVSALAKRLGLSQPTVSHHLRILRQAGLVTYEKMCRDVYYWIEPAGATAMLASLGEVFTAASPGVKKKMGKSKRAKAS